MGTEDKNKLNKEIRKYDGENSFILSLKRNLKSNKYLSKEELGKRQIKVLSDKQYATFKSIIKFDRLKEENKNN